MKTIVDFFLLLLMLFFCSISVFCQKIYKSESGLTMVAAISSNFIDIAIPNYNNFKETFYYNSSFMGGLFYKSNNGIIIYLIDNSISFKINNNVTQFIDVSKKNTFSDSSTDQRVFRTRDGSIQLTLTKKWYNETNTKGFGPPYYTRSYYCASIEKLNFNDDFYYEQSVDCGYLYTSRKGNMISELRGASQTVEQINVYIKERNTVINFFAELQNNSYRRGSRNNSQNNPYSYGYHGDAPSFQQCGGCDGRGWYYSLDRKERLTCISCAGSGGQVR